MMILITGCTGYIGRRLALALLASGIKVRGLVLPAEVEEAHALVEAGMALWEGDLLRPETLQGIGAQVTAVYHLAGLHAASVSRMEALYVGGTRHIIQACRSTHLQSFVVASNSAVYGDCGDDWVTEQHPPTLTHPFGQITWGMEQVLLENYRQNQLPVIMLRVAEVYGPGAYDPLKSLLRGSFHLLGDGNNWTSRIHIDDLLSILQLAPQRLAAGRVYHVADDLPVRQQTFFNDLATFLKVAGPNWLPLESAPDRLKLSIHGLRALSVRLDNQLIKSELGVALRYPTYQAWLAQQVASEETPYTVVHYDG